MEPAAKAARRILWIDVARGIGILLVVAGHVERGLVSAGVASASGWADIDLAIYSFHMALFMWLAGLNVPRTLERGRRPFLLARLKTVYHPYVLWSVIQGGLLVLASGAANGGASWSDIVQVPWRPIMQFWFLYALMAYLLVVAAIGTNARWLIPLAFAALLANTTLGELSLTNRLLFYFPFFILGVLLGDRLDAIQRISLPLLLTAACGWLGALIFIMPRDPLAHIGIAALPCAVLGSVLILGISNRISGTAAKLLAWIGQRSLSIFVMHILASAATRIILMKLMPGAHEALYFVAGLLSGVLLPCLALYVAQRLKLAGSLGLEKKTAGTSS